MVPATQIPQVALVVGPVHLHRVVVKDFELCDLASMMTTDHPLKQKL